MFDYKEPQMLYLLLIMIPVVAITVYTVVHKWKLLKKYKLVENTVRTIVFTAVAAVFVNISLLFMVLTFAQPYSGKTLKEGKTRGRDVVFMIDVSNSMLARDLLPNRLEQAKLSVRDCIDSFNGNRVALVAFSGTSVIKVPFTTDYYFFNKVLEELKPDSVSRGGTRIGDALRKIDNMLFLEENKYRDIVIITDGGDQESYPVDIAARMGEKGIRMLIIGIGNSDKGATIPVISGETEDVLKYNGQEVYTKLDSEVLKQMAAVSPGHFYVNVEDNRINLGSVFTEFIRKSELKTIKSEDRYDYNMVYPFLLVTAVLLMLIASILKRRLWV
jgi:uncharacterized protein YegL